jgi:NCAIR mutase (PurE)-related protein
MQGSHLRSVAIIVSEELVRGLVPVVSLDLASKIVVSIPLTVGYGMCGCAHGPESRLLAL